MDHIDYEEYCNFINEPKHLINPCRDLKLFETPIFEYSSKTPWWRVPIVWGVIILYELSKSEVSYIMTL